MLAHDALNCCDVPKFMRWPKFIAKSRFPSSQVDHRTKHFIVLHQHLFWLISLSIFLSFISFRIYLLEDYVFSSLWRNVLLRCMHTGWPHGITRSWMPQNGSNSRVIILGYGLWVMGQPSNKSPSHPITNPHLFHCQLKHLSFRGLTNPLTSPCYLIGPWHCSHCNEACSRSWSVTHIFNCVFLGLFFQKQDGV